MRSRFLGLALMGLFLGGCVISEQEGRLTPAGRDARQELGEITLHFSSTLNTAIVYGRSALLVALALWLLRPAPGGARSALATALAVAALLGGGFLLFRDLPLLHGFRISAMKDALEVSVPSGSRSIPWTEVEGFEISGFEWRPGPPNTLTGDTLAELPDWRSLELQLRGGDRFGVDLSRLSIEQRQTLANAIADRAGLTKAP